MPAAATSTTPAMIRHVAADTIGVEGYAVDVEAFQKALEKTAREQLDAIVTTDDRKLLGADTAIVAANSPAPAIVAFAKEANIDLVLLGTHG